MKYATLFGSIVHLLHVYICTCFMASECFGEPVTFLIYWPLIPVDKKPIYSHTTQLIQIC